jgi:hypothetical protein
MSRDATNSRSISMVSVPGQDAADANLGCAATGKTSQVPSDQVNTSNTIQEVKRVLWTNTEAYRVTERK